MKTIDISIWRQYFVSSDDNEIIYVFSNGSSKIIPDMRLAGLADYDFDTTTETLIIKKQDNCNYIL